MNLRNLFFSVIAVSLVACGPAVNTTKTTSNDLSIYKTFAYLPNSNFDDLIGIWQQEHWNNCY
jgi:hypothetical protein